jgi:hypothetical protein
MSEGVKHFMAKTGTIKTKMLQRTKYWLTQHMITRETDGSNMPDMVQDKVQGEVCRRSGRSSTEFKTKFDEVPDESQEEVEDEG